MTFHLKSAALVAALSGLSAAHAASCPAGVPTVNGDSAYFVSQSMPNSVRAGQSYAVSMTFCNNGTTPWIYQNLPAGTGYVRLGSLFPRDNQTWGVGRVDLSPGDNIPPGSTKTFNFTVVAPATTSSDVPTNFQFGMLREGVAWFGAGAAESVLDFYTPTITLHNTAGQPPLLPTVAPVVVNANGPSAFSFANFSGANILNETYLQAGANHRSWIPSASQANTIVAAAHNMGLKVLRMPLVIPPDATKTFEYDALAWFPVAPPQTANATNVNAVISAAQGVLNAASAYNMKVILTLDGYTEYDAACTSKNLWKKSFNAVQGNAATIVRALSGYPALYAWDLLNEPLWNASAYGCLAVSPTSFDRSSWPVAQQLPLTGVPASDQSIYEVVAAVHAMYNVVRANDPGNHPTTVGEGQAAYLHYWTDISSFASPHLYVSPVSDIITPQDQANNANGTPLMMEFTGAPSANSAFTTKDAVIQSQLKGIIGADIAVMKSEAVAADFVPLPLVIGEYGVSYNPGIFVDVETQQDDTNYFYQYLNALSSSTQAIYTGVNIGGLVWDLQLPQLLPNYSLITATGALTPAAQCVAIRQGGVGMAAPAGCSP